MKKKELAWRARREKYNKLNKVVLSLFLFIIIGTILMRLTISTLQDVGYIRGGFHLGFWHSPKLAFKPEYDDFIIANPSSNWQGFLDSNPDIKRSITRHPNLFWPFTQFTWLTTIIVMFMITFRIYKFNWYPKWLRWIMTQKALSLVTMYDIVVASIFWVGMYNTFDASFIGDLRIPQIVVTIFVHAVIPILLSIYSLVFLLKDKKASLLQPGFPLRGMIWPLIYTALYLILTIVWDDPYEGASSFHIKLVGSFDNWHHADWGAWASELWKIAVVLTVIYIILGLVTFSHNITLLRMNKNYDPKKDYDALRRRKKTILGHKIKLLKSMYPSNWKKYRKFIK